MAKQTFLRGTLILIAAGMVTRMLGFVNRVVIARFIGEEGVGLYMMAAPTFFLATTLTQFGLPVAISKLVAEASARGDHQKTKNILVMSLTITGVLSLIFTPLFLFFAPVMAETMLTDKRTLYPLLAITPVVPIIAISSVLRGYFQGKQNMNRLLCPKSLNRSSAFHSSLSVRRFFSLTELNTPQRGQCYPRSQGSWRHFCIYLFVLNIKRQLKSESTFSSRLKTENKHFPN